MNGVSTVFAVGWLLFMACWLVAARSVKRSHGAWFAGIRIRVAIVVVVFVLIRVGVLRDAHVTTDVLRTILGFGLFGLGLAFAIWARVHLGRNWGTPMSTKDEPELVTTGPYRLARHPIYTGIVIAGAGTALALNWRWLIVVALAACYFLYAARVEERYLLEEFPDTYPAYRRSTTLLIPFVL